jgi:hypothetical protein
MAEKSRALDGFVDDGMACGYCAVMPEALTTDVSFS